MEQILRADIWTYNYIHRYVGVQELLDKAWIMLAVWPVYLIPLILVIGWFWSARTKRVALKAGIAGILAWRVVSKLIAALVERPRPSDALIEAKELIFHRPDASFPSDHASFVFAVAFTVRFLGHKKLGNALIALSVLISVARVAVGVHFPFDVMAGTIIGLAVAGLVYIWRGTIDKYISEPLINLAKKVGL